MDYEKKFYISRFQNLFLFKLHYNNLAIKHFFFFLKKRKGKVITLINNKIY